MSDDRPHISERFHMRVDLSGALGHAIADLEAYESGGKRARETGRLDELPDATDHTCGVQPADYHRNTLMDGLLVHLKQLRDRTERGDLSALDEFFNLYVFADKPFKYVRQAASEVAA